MTPRTANNNNQIQLLRTLLTIASTEGIKERDVIGVIRFQSSDPILFVLMDEVVGNE